MNVSQAAALLGVSAPVVRALASAGRIPALDVSLPDSRRRSWRFDEHALREAARKAVLRGTQEVTRPVSPVHTERTVGTRSSGVRSGSIRPSGVPDPPWLRTPR